jgi:hypothetical protein
MTLYHKTSVAEALLIVQEQAMNPGRHHLCGPGIFFRVDPLQRSRKAEHSEVTLAAAVDLGNVMMVRASGDDWPDVLDHVGYDSVKCSGFCGADEYIVLDSSHVSSIQFHSNDDKADRFRFTGSLSSSSEDTDGNGPWLASELVEILRITSPPGRRRPVLVKTERNGTGWCHPDSLKPA